VLHRGGRNARRSPTRPVNRASFHRPFRWSASRCPAVESCPALDRCKMPRALRRRRSMACVGARELIELSRRVERAETVEYRPIGLRTGLRGR
jgi:hypothetical protein